MRSSRDQAAPPAHPLAMVYGGGGPFGIAYGAGVAKGLEAAGVPVGEAPALGTSAGSWVASLMALGLGYDDFIDVQSPAVPTRQRGVLVDIAREVFGDAYHPLVRASAFRVTAPYRGPKVLRGEHHRLADICAASSAAPGLLPPHRIEGHTYVDGGVRSVTSIGRADDAAHVIVVAPIARGVMGPGGAAVQFQLDAERRRWKRQHPGRRLTVITPNAEIARLSGRSAKDLFRDDIARAVYPLALAQGERWGARVLAAQAAAAAEAAVEPARAS